MNEGSWTTVGQWNTPDQSGGGGTGLEEGKHQEGEASHSVRVVAEARCTHVVLLYRLMRVLLPLYSVFVPTNNFNHIPTL